MLLMYIQLIIKQITSYYKGVAVNSIAAIFICFFIFKALSMIRGFCITGLYTAYFISFWILRKFVCFLMSNVGITCDSWPECRMLYLTVQQFIQKFWLVFMFYDWLSYFSYWIVIHSVIECLIQFFYEYIYLSIIFLVIRINYLLKNFNLIIEHSIFMVFKKYKDHYFKT